MYIYIYLQHIIKIIKKHMKSIDLRVILLLLSTTLLLSCSVQKNINKSEESKNPSVNASSTGLVVKPVVADLEISSNKKSIIYKADISLPISDLKANAIKTFLDSNKCDYVIDPQFVRTINSTDNKIKEVEFTLTGFPATFKKLYQTDSLPKSVIEFSQIKLQVERVEFNTLNQSTTRGARFGLEFGSGLNFSGAQVDVRLAQNFNFYFSYEEYFSSMFSSSGEVSFNEVVNSITTFNKKTYTTMNSISLGVFKEKFLGSNFKIRGGIGINILNVGFDEPLINNTQKTSYDGVISTGIRLGTAIDYSLFKGFSLVGRVHSNLGLLNNIVESGFNSFETNSIRITNVQILNFSIGPRFIF